MPRHGSFSLHLCRSGGLASRPRGVPGDGIAQSGADACAFVYSYVDVNGNTNGSAHAYVDAYVYVNENGNAHAIAYSYADADNCGNVDPHSNALANSPVDRNPPALSDPTGGRPICCSSRRLGGASR